MREYVFQSRASLFFWRIRAIESSLGVIDHLRLAQQRFLLSAEPLLILLNVQYFSNESSDLSTCDKTKIAVVLSLLQGFLF